MIWIGMDVHKDTVMAAVFEGEAREAEVVREIPNDLRKFPGRLSIDSTNSTTGSRLGNAIRLLPWLPPANSSAFSGP
jgi:hypothetical protein